MERMFMRKAILGISVILLIWVTIAPFLCTAGSIIHLDGQVGIIDHGDLWARQNPVAMAIYTMGDFFCHQEQSRTFMLNGNEMPFCVRDVSMLVGFIIGLFFMIFFDIERNRTADTFIVCSFGLIILDWTLQKILSSNMPVTRVMTGLFAGAAIAMLICFFADRIHYSVR